MRMLRASCRSAILLLVAALVQGCAAGRSPVPKPAGATASDVGVESEFVGVWLGSYHCAQGPTALRLTLRPAAPGGVAGTFEFSALAENPEVPEGSFEMTGRISGRRIVLEAGRWIRQPEGYLTVDLTGTLAADSQSMTGAVENPSCTTFSLRRGGSESEAGRPSE